jgi:protease-4
LDVREPMMDQRPANPFSSVGRPPSLLDTLGKIEAAADDDRVRGLDVRAATGGMAPAQAEEIRTAIAHFRESGKFVIADWQNDGVRM